MRWHNALDHIDYDSMSSMCMCRFCPLSLMFQHSTINSPPIQYDHYASGSSLTRRHATERRLKAAPPHVHGGNAVMNNAYIKGNGVLEV